MFPNLDEATSVYRECAAAPVPAKATFRQIKEGALSVTTNWTQRDLERSENIIFQSVHLVLPDDGGNKFGRIVNAGCTNEIKAESLSSLSPSGSRTAVIREVKNKKGEEKQYLEVWNGNCKIHNIDLLVQEKHGKVYEDELFGSLSWSSSETHLAYIAEKKRPKTTSYFDSKFQKREQSNDPGKDEPIKGDENILHEEWGEMLVSKHHPVVCVLDLRNQTISILDGIPDEVSAGHAVWTPDDSGIVFIGWFHDPYRLGIRYCYNKRSALYHAKLDGSNCEVLSGTDQCLWCPWFSPDQTKLVYLQNAAGGTHQHCTQLIMYDWVSKETKVVVDTIQKPTADCPFPGIYSFGESPSQKCWLADSRRLVLLTVWGSKLELIVINTSSCHVTRLTFDPEYWAWTVLDVKDDVILATRCAPNRWPQLVIGELPSEGHEAEIVWAPLDSNAAQIKDINCKIFQLQAKTETEPPDHKIIDYEAILVTPNSMSKEKLPLVVIPHGGPHGLALAEFSTSELAFCKLGFAVLLVNYRGSLGFGEAGIQCLPGRIGRQDVDDVQNAVLTVLDSGMFDQNCIFLSGLSHGGFLVAHLIGQFPDFYKACALKSPAINIASILGGTDLPGWAFCEAGVGPFEFDKLPSAEMYKAMLNKSPIIHAHKVKTPTLIMIGTDDQRVPPKQGQEYYRALKARGINTKMLVYSNNCHTLDSVDAEADCFMNMYKWFTTFA